MTKAIVAFHNHSEHWLASLLQPGFKHCMVAVLDEDWGWIEIDFRGGTPTVRVMAAPEFDLIKHYGENDIKAVETETIDTIFRSPCFVANCVGLVKAILGIRKPSIITPYQLWRYLK